MTAMTDKALDYYTPAQLALVLNTTTAALAQRRHRGLGPVFYRVGRSVGYLPTSVVDVTRNLDSLTGESPFAPEPLLTTKQVAAWLNISEGALGNFRWAGEGPVWISIGRAVRYRRQDIEDFMKAQSKAPLPTYSHRNSSAAVMRHREAYGI